MFAKQTKPEIMKLPCLYSHLTSSTRYLVRQKYIEQQDGLCWYCEVPITEEPSNEVVTKDIDSDLFPSDFFKHPIHLHHDHDTDLTIGAVHAYCNAVLWEYEGE